MKLAPTSPIPLERLERITETPLTVLAFTLMPVLAGIYFWNLTPLEERIYDTLQTLIWACFALAFLTKLAVAPAKREYLRRNWIEVALIIVPIFRPLRIVRPLVYIARDIRNINRLMTFESLLAYGIGIIILAATVVTTAEQNAPGANIQTFPDALYWSLVTVSTVGYGDHYPVTVVGKFTAVALMFFGIGIFSGIVAKIVAAFSNP